MPLSLAVSDVVEKASRELDNPLIESNIVLKGALLNTYSLGSFDDVAKLIERECGNKMCFARIYIEEPVEATLSLYVSNGVVVAAILKLGGETVYGVQAVKDDRVARATRIRMVLYEIDVNMLATAASSVVEYFTKVRRGLEVATEVAKPRVAEEATARAMPSPGMSVVQARRMILDDVKRLGLPVTDLTIAEGERFTTVDVICDKSKPLYSPEEVGLVVLKRIFQYSTQSKDIRLSVHHRKTYAKTYEASKKKMWIALGTAPEYILVKFEGNLRIEDIKYKEKRGVLDVSIVLRRESLYSVASVQEIARGLYEEMKKVWDGELRVRVRIGRFGLEGRAP